jgi:hypothetical protein
MKRMLMMSPVSPTVTRASAGRNTLEGLASAYKPISISETDASPSSSQQWFPAKLNITSASPSAMQSSNNYVYFKGIHWLFSSIRSSIE